LSPTAVSQEATKDFLRRHAPFNRIGDQMLAYVASKLRRARFAKDARILWTSAEPVAHLHIVERGLVASRPNNTQADPDRTIGPGELFPVGALSTGSATTKVYSALQDTTCYLLARDDFLELRRRSPEFERFCTQAIAETLKQSLESLHSQYSQRLAEQQSLTRTLAQLIRHPPVACPATSTLREAVQKMADANVRTIIALGPDGAPVGMFTLVDLLRRVVLPGLPLDSPLAAAMTSPLVTLPASATAYEGMHVMAERGVRQLAVVENGRIAGVVSERDLFALQRVSLRQVNEGLHSANTVDKLKRAAEDIRLLAPNLLAQGVGAEPLTRTIAALNDALSRRTIDLVLARHALHDIDWCWLALGSEGRSEQTFATDQDNALLFAAPDPAATAQIRERLLAFARDVNASLDALGFPLCTGNVMASNPQLCLSTEEWKAKFLHWIREPTPQALLGANIVFDFRALYGDSNLCDALRVWLFRYTEANGLFLRMMVANALATDAPVGLIRAFTVDDEPAVKGTIDLKSRGTRLFVDCARVFALALGIPDTGTAPRLRQAGERLHVERRHVDATVEAFHFLQLLRLRQQDLPAGEAAANPNRIDPYALNEIDQRMLKEAFRQAKQLQERLRMSYRL
jgi:CBS domain-containing protein